MNKKKIFATILCGVFGLSIASGALVANFAHTEEPTIAAPDATRLYVIPGANWSKDGADIAAYIYGGTTTATWYPLETIEGLDNTNILATPEIANLSAATNVIFGRFADGTNDSKSWGWLNPPMYNRSQGGDYAIKLNIAEHNIYRIDNNAGGNLDDSAWGFTGDDLVATTNEIGVKFDEVDFAGESVSWYGYTATNGLQGDQIYAMSGTLALNENGIYVGKVSSVGKLKLITLNYKILLNIRKLINFHYTLLLLLNMVICGEDLGAEMVQFMLQILNMLVFGIHMVAITQVVTYIPSTTGKMVSMLKFFQLDMFPSVKMMNNI